MQLGTKIFKSFLWKYFERFSYQIVQFIVQVVLARILLPDDFGVISIINVFIAICNVFIQSGFNMSLVQKKDVTDQDYSSVFVAGLIISIFLYLILFFSSPLIAEFYDMPVLKPAFRVLSISLIISSLNSVQIAYLVRNLQYKKLFICNFISALVSGFLGIVLAKNDFGVWALIIQQILYLLISTVIMLFLVKWKIKIVLNKKRIKYLFSFGWKLLCSGLIDTIYNNIYELIIGKKFSQSSLAYYSKGKQFPALLVDNINSSISSVMLASLSKIQDDIKQIKETLKSSIIISTTVLFPIMLGLAVVARPLVSLLLTDKWLDCVPLMQLLCISYCLMPIHTMNLQAMNSIGRSDMFLKIEIIKKVIAFIILIVTVPLGIYGMVFGQIAVSLISTIINSSPNKKFINYGSIEQLKDIFPQLFLSIIMAIVVSLFTNISPNNLTILSVQCIIGVVAYLGLGICFKLKGFRIILGLLKTKKH